VSTDERLQKLRRAALQGDAAALAKLEAEIARRAAVSPEAAIPVGPSVAAGEVQTRVVVDAAPTTVTRCMAIKKDGHRCSMTRGLGVVSGGTGQWRRAVLCPGHWKNTPERVVPMEEA